jgi:hypothetical protein
MVSKLIFTNWHDSSGGGGGGGSFINKTDSSCFVVAVVVIFHKIFNFTFPRFREFWQSL